MTAKKAREFTAKTGKLHWFHWLIILLSLTLTFSAWYFTKAQVEEKTRLQFERDTDQALALINERMGKYEEALWAGVAAMHSQSHGIDAKEWKRFSNALRIDKRFPGINGIGVIYHVPPNNLDGFLAEQRVDRSDFSLHPKHKKNEFWPITYIEPVETNYKAIGLDIAHEENRHTAAKKARDTGLSQITGPIILVQDSGKTPGFLFYSPFYKGDKHESLEDRKNNFTGLVYAPFIVHKLMDGTLGREVRRIGIKISDEKEVLYNEHIETEPDFDPTPLFQTAVDIEMYGRTWHIDVRSAKSFREAVKNHQPMVILLGGIIIDILLVTFFLMLSRSNQRALSLARSMTQDLQENKEKLENLVEKLSDSNEELERFAYVASHDLQEPLRMVRNFTALLGQKYADQLDDDAKNYISIAVSSSARMQELVNDLLEYSRLGKEAEKFETINPDKIIEYVMQNLQDNIETFNAKITYDPLPAFKGNPVRFSRLMQNLIGNSLKYQSEDATPEIHITSEEKGDEHIFSVKDNGIGMKNKYFGTIFQPFKRLHTHSEFSGSGMGLAICKKIVENMDGKIWVESKEGKGTTFFFTVKKKQSA